jgi:formylglycine-generating enzyme required for sulfatase activity/serine/threonine protein kinase
MDPPVGSHPSADTLHAFGLGKLGEARAKVVMAHVEQCPQCRQVVAAQSGDDFLARLRDAHGRGRTPAPGMGLAGQAPWPVASDPTRLPTPLIANLPPELAGHAQYEILRELGRGGMGVVYLARNRILARLEVLKVVNQDVLERAGGKERFLREIQAAAMLSHRNVVAAYAALPLGGMLVFAMEYVEGDDLAKVVKAGGPLPVVNACYYAQQVALGLQHAFEKQMVHRDIKPQNLILSRDGKKHVVKILDFGLAKMRREKTEASDLTGTGKMLGTPDYIAPEQTLDAARADIRADIYSLGCTLYYLLAGHAPFQGQSLYAVLQAHHTEQAKPLDQVRPEVPAALAAVVAKMMAKDPGQRYQRPAEVAQALTAFVKPAGRAAASTVPAANPSPARGMADIQNAGAQGSMPLSPFKPETLIEGGGAIIQRKKAARKPVAASDKKGKKWPIAVGFGISGFLLAVLVALWAGGVLRVQTKGGTVALEKEPGPGAAVKMATQAPPLARAPFDANQAREHQQTWARFLGRKVEQTLDLGGGVTMEFVLVPPGTFTMGSPLDEKERSNSEEPHEVTISKPFYMGKYEVTQAQYQCLTGTNPSWFSTAGSGRDKVVDQDTRRLPVETVSWEEAAAYCAALGRKTGRAARLPSEAEWEYACRAGTTSSFHFDGQLNGTQANCYGAFPYGTSEKGPYLDRTCRVGSYPGNAFGLYDMHGNVWEWCQDWFGPYMDLKMSPEDPVRVDDGPENARVLRGGSWNNVAVYCRAAYRSWSAPGARINLIGLRVCFRPN